MSLIWRFGADTGPFRRGLDQMRTESKAFGKELGRTMRRAFSFLTAGGVIAGATSLIRKLDEIDRAARRLNVAPGFVQELDLLAKANALDLDNLVEFLQDVNEKAIDAAAGSGEAAQAFQMLGLEAEQFQRLDLRQQFLGIADAVANATDQQRANAAVMKIGSDEATKLLPALREGSDGIEKMTGGMSKFGEESTAALRAAREELAKFGAEIGNTAIRIGGELVMSVKGAARVVAAAFKDLTTQTLTSDDYVNLFFQDFDEQFKKAQEQMTSDAEARQEALRREAILRQNSEQAKADEKALTERDRRLRAATEASERTRSSSVRESSRLKSAFSGVTEGFAEELASIMRGEAGAIGGTPSVPVTSLQSIGGSTGVGGVATDRAAAQRATTNNLLSKLVELNSKGDNGTASTVEPKVP